MSADAEPDYVGTKDDPQTAERPAPAVALTQCPGCDEPLYRVVTDPAFRCGFCVEEREAKEGKREEFRRWKPVTT